MQPNISHFIRNFPITSAIFAFNVLIFLANRLGVIPPVISMPGMLNTYTFLAHFSHWDLMHVAFNLLVLAQISPLIEQKIRGFFYLLIILAIWFLLVAGGVLLLETPTLGFSGIGLGLITFCGLLYKDNPHLSKQLLAWAGINILIGLLPGISFLMHFLGALAGVLIFGLYQLGNRIR